MSARDRFRHWFTGWVVLIDERLQVFLFGLMGFGLVIASVFLWRGLISGDNWVAVCGILFGSNAIGGGLSQLGRSRQLASVDDGSARPLS